MDVQSRSASPPLLAEHAKHELADQYGFPLANYEQLESLGRGGWGEVFRAIQKVSGRQVAIKIPHDSVEAHRRFDREVKYLGRIDHQNVIEICDAGVGWYAMPLAEGSLTDLAGELCDEERVRLVDQVAAGLAAVHGAGLVHRDISPNNILRVVEGENSRWCVSDFGMVRKPVGQSSVPHTRGVLGTEDYVAPEVWIYGAHAADKKSDIFSLGRTVKVMTTARSPRSETRVPEIWETLVVRMTAQAVAQRFQSMEEVRAALAEVTTRLKDQRRAEWEQTRLAAGGLLPQEITVLGWILRATNKFYREHEVFKKVPAELRVAINIGLVGLRRRKFIEEVTNDHGEPWGDQLTEPGMDWALANATALDRVQPEPDPRVDEAEPPPPNDEDAPF